MNIKDLLVGDFDESQNPDDLVIKREFIGKEVLCRGVKFTIVDTPKPYIHSGYVTVNYYDKHRNEVNVLLFHSSELEFTK
jgi:hypothetical protein